MTGGEKFFLFAVVIFLAYPSEALSQSRTLKRTEDAVIVSGDNLSSLSGAEIDDLKLIACRGKSCKPIAHQVDKRDGENRYVFPDDKRFDPLRDGTKLDSNDELAFMASDAGGGINQGEVPFKASRVIEIEILDPMEGGKAWVYLAEGAEGLPEIDLPDYVSYALAGDNHCIRGDRYFLSWQDTKPYYHAIRLKGADGELGPDILDRQRSGVVAAMAQQDMTINMPESMAVTRDLGFIDGPVRVVVDEIAYINFVNLKLQWGSEYFFSLYRFGHINLIDAKLPTQMNRIFRNIQYYWAMDFSPEVIGSTYRDPAHGTGISIRGVPAEVANLDAEHYWWSLHGDWGSVMEMMVMGPEIAPYFRCEGMLIQDPEAKDKHGQFPGRLQIGLSCHDIEKIPKKADIQWRNFLLFPEKNSAEGVEALVNMVMYPLQVETRPVTVNAGAESPSSTLGN